MIEPDQAIRDALLCAREESYLWELSQSLQARFPEAAVLECEAAGRKSAFTLLMNGWVQIVATTWAALASSSGSILSQDEAVAVLREPRNWSVPPTNQEPCFHLLITEAGRAQPF